MILKFALIPIVGRTGFAFHTKHTAEATQGYTSFMRDILEQRTENVP